MSLPTPTEIRDVILELMEVHNSLYLVDAICRALTQLRVPGTIADLQQHASSIERRVRINIEKYISKEIDQQVTPLLEWSKSDTRRLLSKSVRRTTTGLEVYSSPLRLKKPIREFLLSNEITPRRFEHLCERVFTDVLRCSNAKATEIGADDGLDIIGIRPLTDLTSGATVMISDRLLESNRTIFVGQAKRNRPDRNVGTPLVRDLLGAVEVLREGAQIEDGTISQVLEDLDLIVGRRDHIIPVFITTSGYSYHASRLANRFRIVAIGGAQLAEMLVDLGVGTEMVNGGYVYDEASIQDWIDG